MKQFRVVILEDEELMAHLLQGLLSSFGFEVLGRFASAEAT